MTGRTLAEPAFPGDDGQVDPSLRDAVGASNAELLSRFGAARVFVPVVAVLTSDADQAMVDSDKNAEMSAVMMTGVDGRRALLTFTDVAALEAWNPQARPVPVYGRDAARSALAEGAAALLVDVGSEHFTVIETDDVRHLAAGHALVRTAAGVGWAVGDESDGGER